jgi:hypothetical protein
VTGAGATGRIRDHKRQMLRGVPRRVHHAHFRLADAEHLAIPEEMIEDRRLGFCFRRAEQGAELAVTGGEAFGFQQDHASIPR